MSKVVGASVSTYFVAVFWMLSTFSKAANINDMTGKWYSETTEDKLFDGTIRKDLAVSRADGTKTITARYYAGNQCVAERIATFRWGVDNNVYWTECKTLRKYGAALACPARMEYELISVTPNEFQYKSKKAASLTPIVACQTISIFPATTPQPKQTKQLCTQFGPMSVPTPFTRQS